MCVRKCSQTEDWVYIVNTSFRYLSDLLFERSSRKLRGFERYFTYQHNTMTFTQHSVWARSNTSKRYFTIPFFKHID